MTLGDFAHAVSIYCAITNASVTSWIRSAARNERVGGVKYSSHQVGLGADVVYDIPLDVDGRKEWAKRLNLKLIVESDHDHIQPMEWAAG